MMKILEKELYWKNRYYKPGREASGDLSCGFLIVLGASDGFPRDNYINERTRKSA